MKIFYLNIFVLLFNLSVVSQNFHVENLTLHNQKTNVNAITNTHKSTGDTILINSFDDSNDWTLSSPDPNSSNNLQGQWEILTTTPTDVNTYMGGMASTSASDGFAVFNGIQYLLTANVDYQDATLELNNAIDLSNYPAVSIEFEQRYKAFNYDETYIEFSTDLGLTWQAIQLNDQVVTNDPSVQELVELNVSSIIGGQSNVKIRFRWISPTDDDSFGSGYGWMVDDLKITVPPNDDIQNLSSWIFGENNYGAEYGRTPIAHVDQNYYVGSYIFNYGALDQTNIVVNGTFTGPTNFNTTASAALVENDSSIAVQSLNAVSFGVGVYNGEITVSSDGDSVGSDNFGNNSYFRNFEITNDVYSLDGIGNHPAGTEALGSLGSNSWTSAADGLICATLYPIKQTEILNSVRAYITASSAAQSEVILYIIDSVSFMNGMMGNAIYSSDLYSVTATDIVNEYIDFPVATNAGWDPVNNTTLWENLEIPPGNYYAAVELFSGGNTNDIRIVDDNTVGQPAWSSAIWFPQDQAYTNGNAFAIRLYLGENVSVNENNIEDIEIYPNPSNGIVNIKTNIENNIIIVRDVQGKIILNDRFNKSTIIDLSNNPKGIYLFEITNENQTLIKKISFN